MSFVITVSQHLASLVMPNGGPRDGFSYPTLTLMMASYTCGIKPATSGLHVQGSAPDIQQMFNITLLNRLAFLHQNLNQPQPTPMTKFQ